MTDDLISLNILMVEDSPDDAKLIEHEFKAANLHCELTRVDSMPQLQAALEREDWDVVLSDYALPSMSAPEVIHEIRALKPHLPIILVSGSVGEERAVEAIRFGARDYVLKDKLTRLASAVIREVKEARQGLYRAALELEVTQSRNRFHHLCRYFPKVVAEKIAHGDNDDPFVWHRSHVAVVFVDLRGFSRLVEMTEASDVVQILNDFYSQVAEVVSEFQGAIGHVAGDGVMIFFNDPLELPNPEQTAVNAALRLRDLLSAMCKARGDSEFNIEFGAGVAAGYATVGLFGVEGCWDYSVIGTVSNLASRLCAAALPGQILAAGQVLEKIHPTTTIEPLGDQHFKGFQHPMPTFNIK